MSKITITPSHKHRRHPSVIVKVPDCKGSDPGSIPGQISKFVG